MLQPIQIALTTLSMTGSLKLYAEAFGFRNAGGQCSWGSKIQGLGPDAQVLLWWLVGQQDFFQVELFQYTHPVTRPLPADWRPCDHGWIRFGIVVADFDACMKVLQVNGIDPLAPAIVKDGRRHVAIRDPYVGAVIEIMERDPAQPEGPRVAYVTSSVSDLDSARSFYRDILQFEILPLDRLHASSDEALWGLGGADREGFVVGRNNVFLEIVHYRDPLGRPKRKDHRLSDQGIMNIAIGARQGAPVSQALKRLKEAGFVPPYTQDNGPIVCGYINVPEREFELLSVPEEMNALAGFEPAAMNFVGVRNAGK